MAVVMFYVVPVYHVRAVAGQQARLPCDISLVSDEEDDLSDSGVDSPPLDGESSLASGTNLRDAVLLVLWYRDDLGTPIYRYFNYYFIYDFSMTNEIRALENSHKPGRYSIIFFVGPPNY